MSSQAISPIDKPSTPTPGAHLAFLDSLRGLAALYVVGFHSEWQLRSIYPSINIKWFKLFFVLFAHGHSAVDLFIVLSGFCLMIPVAKAGGQMVKGKANFFARRSHRILPPYYYCLAFTAAIVWFRARVASHYGVALPDYTQHFYIEFSITHLLMIQNLFTEFNDYLNGPLWTLATEWQIYFAFAFWLLPMFRKLGPLPTIFIAYVVGLATFPSTDLREACLWFLGLFAMGMVAADLCFSPNPKLRLGGNALVVISALCALCSICSRYLLSKSLGDDPLTDLFVGGCCASFIAYLAQRDKLEAGSIKSRILSFLSYRPLVSLGLFSYSLYMVHMPILQLLATFFQAFKLSGTSAHLALYLMAIPVIVAISYGFHVLFERPFMNVRLVSDKASPSMPSADQAIA